jgi:hypothetical protein
MVRLCFIPLVLAVNAGLWSGCAEDTDAVQRPEERLIQGRISFEEFAASVPRESDLGIYVVEQDLPIYSLADLRRYYEANYNRGALLQTKDGFGNELRVPDAQKLSMTYCISNAGTYSFGAKHAQVVAAINQAAASWNATAEILFSHSPGFDSTCTPSNTNVWFSVEYRATLSSGAFAIAFRPDAETLSNRARRNLIITEKAFESTQRLNAVTRHELGHILGFAHEFNRNNPPDCPVDSSFSRLTPPDGASIMTLDSCDAFEVQSELTTMDANGAAQLYGAKWSTLSASFIGGAAVSKTATKRLDLFVRGTDNLLKQRTFSNGQWSSSWTSHSGTISSTPSAVSPSANRIDVFARDSSGFLTKKTYSNGAWSNWTPLDTNFTIQEKPTAISRDSNTIDVFARGSDSRIWRRTYTISSNTWSAWSQLPSPTSFNDAPAVTSWDGVQIDVFARATGTNTLYQTTFNGSSWSSWTTHSGIQAVSPPAAHGVRSDESNVSVFVRASDNMLWQRRRINGELYNWVRTGGTTTFTTGPGVGTWGDGWIVFMRGTDGNIKYTWFNVNDPNEV